MKDIGSTRGDIPGASVVHPVHAFGRAEPRHTTVLLAARLRTDAADYFCRVRNISAKGMMLEATVPIAPGTAVEVELRNVHAVPGRVVWSKAGKAGLSFAETIDVDTVLAPPPPSGRLTRQRRRHPRFDARCPVDLGQGAGLRGATLLNVSQHGCRLRVSAPLGLAEQLKIAIPGLPARAARVRWVQGMEAGLIFYEALPFADLAPWLGDHAKRYAARELTPA